MASNKPFGVGRALALVAVVFLFILSLGAVITLLEYTLIRWWIPILCAGVFAVATGTILWKVWRRLTGSGSFPLNYAIHIIFTTFFLAGLYLTINFTGKSSMRKEEVTVESKVREKHYRSRRVGRNRYVRGNPYYEYYVKVKMDDGSIRKVRVNYHPYLNIRSGEELTLSISKGALGLPVIHPDMILTDNPSLSAPPKDRKCKFFGTTGKK